jgi:hypothetical protein
LLFAKEETLGPSNLRLAAGVGVVAAVVMVGGPTAAVAIADTGHGSHSGRSDNNRSGSSSGGSSRSGSDWSDDNVNNGTSGGTNANGAGRPSSRVGSGRESGTSDERPSADFSPDPPAQGPPGQVGAPKVTFGDGRTPGVQDHDPEPRWTAPEPAAPPPPPEVITVPLNPPTFSTVHDAGVIEQLATAPTTGLADPLWGVAGLILIPAAGAVLGVRQARAAHAASELSRRP